MYMTTYIKKHFSQKLCKGSGPQTVFALPLFLYLMIITTFIACKNDNKEEVKPNYSGKYIGTIEGTFFPDPQIPTGTSYSEMAEFIITDNGNESSIAGFDSVPAKIEFSKADAAAFGIEDVRSSGDTRINGSGNFSGDTLKMTGSYLFIDRSRRQYRFVGIKR